jgi:hypothetical protein
LRCVWEGAGQGCAPGFHMRPFHKKGAAVQGRWDAFMAACQLAGISAAGLILLIDLAFDTDFLSILAQAMLAAFACALIFAVWTDQGEWWP